MKKILVVAGARPNFIKIAQFRKTIRSFPSMEMKIVHTGQHYDPDLSDIFFRQLNVFPDFFLDIPPSTPEALHEGIRERLGKLLRETYAADLVLVTGDVNSTRAAAETAAELSLPLAHIESGLRSFDPSMPEEHNRIVTDRLSNYLFITEQSGIDNLLREGKKEDFLFFVGNTMIDTLIASEPLIMENDIEERLGLRGRRYMLLTLHRPSNVDTEDALREVLEILRAISAARKLVLPLHPRTKKSLESTGMMAAFAALPNLILAPPLGYFALQKLVAGCEFVITDSGGLQEESTFRRKPCLTMRENTERPVTVEVGTNTLTGRNGKLIQALISSIDEGTYRQGEIPPLWDGKAGLRIFTILERLLR